MAVVKFAGDTVALALLQASDDYLKSKREKREKERKRKRESQ